MPQRSKHVVNWQHARFNLSKDVLRGPYPALRADRCILHRTILTLLQGRVIDVTLIESVLHWFPTAEHVYKTHCNTLCGGRLDNCTEVDIMNTLRDAMISDLRNHPDVLMKPLKSKQWPQAKHDHSLFMHILLYGDISLARLVFGKYRFHEKYTTHRKKVTVDCSENAPFRLPRIRGQTCSLVIHPLHYAILNRSKEWVQLLSDTMIGVEPETVKATCFALAASRSVEMVDLVYFKLKLQTFTDVTPYAAAVGSGIVEVTTFFEKYREINCEMSKRQSFVPLQIGSPEMLKFLYAHNRLKHVSLRNAPEGNYEVNGLYASLMQARSTVRNTHVGFIVAMVMAGCDVNLSGCLSGVSEQKEFLSFVIRHMHETKDRALFLRTLHLHPLWLDSEVRAVPVQLRVTAADNKATRVYKLHMAKFLTRCNYTFTASPGTPTLQNTFFTFVSRNPPSFQELQRFCDRHKCSITWPRTKFPKHIKEQCRTVCACNERLHSKFTVCLPVDVLQYIFDNFVHIGWWDPWYR